MNTTISHAPVIDARYVLVSVVLFENERDIIPKPWSGQCIELFGEVHEPRESKAGTGCFSFAVYRDGATRGNMGIEWVTATVVDLDGLTNEQLYHTWRWLSDYVGVLYTSYSDRAKGRCARLIVLLTRWLSPEEARLVRDEVVRMIGVPADNRAKDPARIWYRPSCPPEQLRAHFIRYSQGVLLDPDPILARVRAATPTTTQRPSSAVEDWRDLVTNGAPEGSRNDTVSRLAGHLLRKGVDAHIARHLIVAWNANSNSPPLPEREVVEVVNSIAGRELARRKGRHGRS